MSRNYIVPVPLSSINSTTFTGAYQLVATLPRPCLIVRMVNNSAVLVTISYDGVNDHDVIPTLGVLQLDIQANAGATNYTAFLRQGTSIYVKAAASTGLFYVSGYSQLAS